MKIKPPYLVVAGLLLITVIYFLGRTTAPKKNETAMSGHVGMPVQSVSAVDLEAIIAQAKNNLKPDKAIKIDSLTNQFKNSNNKTVVLQQLINAWKLSGSKIITAEYAKQLAENTNNASDYATAGDLLVTAFENAADSTMAKALSDDAFNTLQKAIELDTNNIDNRVNMAATLMEGRKQIMDGVPILLEIVKKSPNHLKANFILAKFAVVSGQNDKAIARLDKIIALYPDYTDAYLVMAKAYTAKGEMMKAKATLQTCEKHLKDAQAKAEVQQMIEKFN